MTAKVWSVTQINRYIKGLINHDGLLISCAVTGEVSNLKYHSSGHIYFSLKDRTSAITCVMFAGNRRGLAFPMKDGDKVIVRGSVDLFERDGRCQLYAKRIELAGAGDLYARFLALKKELEECGYFDPAFKRPVPAYASRVGIVTAPGGAAIRDIQNIARRRNPYVQLILAPALVQGEGAKESIARGIEMLDGRVDVIIVGRGGGSYEDLWAFNERIVADAINECGTPVISAVGHETDVTIADFVADLRAPTPSAAAELAVFDYRLFREQTERTAANFRRCVAEKIRQAQQKTRWYEARIRAVSPAVRFGEASRRAESLAAEMGTALRDRIGAAEEERAYLSEKMNSLMEGKIAGKKEEAGALEGRIAESMASVMRERRMHFAIILERMKGLNPLGRLSQGYSYTEDSGGHAVTSVAGIRAGETLRTWVLDGWILSEVSEAEASEPGAEK